METSNLPPRVLLCDHQLLVRLAWRVTICIEIRYLETSMQVCFTPSSIGRNTPPPVGVWENAIPGTLNSAAKIAAVPTKFRRGTSLPPTFVTERKKSHFCRIG